MEEQERYALGELSVFTIKHGEVETDPKREEYGNHADHFRNV